MCGREDAQVWAQRLVSRRVYGARMSRWIRRCVNVQVCGSEGAQMGKRAFRCEGLVGDEI